MESGGRSRGRSSGDSRLSCPLFFCFPGEALSTIACGQDPGCIYFFDGPLCCYGTTVTHNFCHNNKKGGKGLYLDGTTSGITTHGNVLWNISGNAIDNNDVSRTIILA